MLEGQDMGSLISGRVLLTEQDFYVDTQITDTQEYLNGKIGSSTNYTKLYGGSCYSNCIPRLLHCKMYLGFGFFLFNSITLLRHQNIYF